MNAEPTVDAIRAELARVDSWLAAEHAWSEEFDRRWARARSYRRVSFWLGIAFYMASMPVYGHTRWFWTLEATGWLSSVASFYWGDRQRRMLDEMTARTATLEEAAEVARRRGELN